jgi:LysM repeat protein
MPQALDKNTRRAFFELAKALYPEHADEENAGQVEQEDAGSMQNVVRGADNIVHSSFQKTANSLYPDDQSPDDESSSPPNGSVHVMRPGDTLWGLSHLYDVSLKYIQAANPQITDPTKIPVGANINVPDSCTDQGNRAPATNDAAGKMFQESPASAAMKKRGASNGISDDDWEDLSLYTPPGAVWGENGLHDITNAKSAHPLTGMALRPYETGEKFAHGVVAAGNGYPFDRVLVAQAQGKEKEVNLRQLCKEAGLDCGLIKMLNFIPDDQTTIPHGAKLLLPNYSDDSALLPGAKLRKRLDMTHAHSEYLAAMEEVRKNPQMMQYMEKDKTGDPFRAIAYVRSTPIPSNDWSVRNWLRIAENNRNHTVHENPEQDQTVGYWLTNQRQDEHNPKDVISSPVDNKKKIVDNNLVAAERFANMREGVWDFFPGAQPLAGAYHRLQKANPSYHGGSTDVDFVENWGQEGNRLRQLDKARRKAGQ